MACSRKDPVTVRFRLFLGCFHNRRDNSYQWCLANLAHLVSECADVYLELSRDLLSRETYDAFDCFLIGQVLLQVRVSTTLKPFENAHHLGSTVSIKSFGRIPDRIAAFPDEDNLLI